MAGSTPREIHESLAADQGVRDGAGCTPEDVNARPRSSKTDKLEILRASVKAGDWSQCAVALSLSDARSQLEGPGGKEILHGILQRGPSWLGVEVVNRFASVNIKDASGLTPLHVAARRGQTEVVKALIKQGANVNLRSSAEGQTALFGAVEHDHVTCAEVLIDSGAHLEAEDSWKQTPLFAACFGGSTHCVAILLENGANVQAADDVNDTPLHVAAKEGFPNCLDLLIEFGGDLHALNQTRQTPIFQAAEGGDFDCIDILMYHGANVNDVDINGNTPLHLAAEGGQPGSLELLIKHGAPVGVKNKKQQTPADVAAQKGLFPSVQVLAEHGADVTNVEKDGWRNSHARAFVTKGFKRVSRASVRLVERHVRSSLASRS